MEGHFSHTPKHLSQLLSRKKKLAMEFAMDRGFDGSVLQAQ